MKTKNFVANDSVTVNAACGFQPDWIFVGTGGTMIVHTYAGDDVPITVFTGQWWPADNVVRVNATSTTATGFVGLQT
jgi:hypothetical protein